MILAILITNPQDNILVERFNGVPSEERVHWRSFLTKLGQTNLKGVKHDDELFIAYQKCISVYCLHIVWRCEHLCLSEVISSITTCIKDICGKPPSERRFLDKYGKICLCLDEIFWKGVMENNDKERVKRLTKLKPPTEF
ncbi:DNA polymerase processivity factor [Bienertia sinuspersici]